MRLMRENAPLPRDAEDAAEKAVRDGKPADGGDRQRDDQPEIDGGRERPISVPTPLCHFRFHASCRSARSGMMMPIASCSGFGNAWNPIKRISSTKSAASSTHRFMRITPVFVGKLS